MNKLYTIKEMSALTGISYQNLWSRFKKNNICPVAEKKAIGESNKYSLKQFAQILTPEEAKLLPEEIEAEVKVCCKEKDGNELLQDIICKMTELENHLAEQDKMIKELKKEIRLLAKKHKKK